MISTLTENELASGRSPLRVTAIKPDIASEQRQNIELDTLHKTIITDMSLHRKTSAFANKKISEKSSTYIPKPAKFGGFVIVSYCNNYAQNLTFTLDLHSGIHELGVTVRGLIQLYFEANTAR